MAQHQEWSPVWWAAPPGCIPHQWLRAGQRSQLPTPATRAPPCTPRDMGIPVTCTRPWQHAGILSTSTCNTFPALPTSMGKPPQAGLNEDDWYQPSPHTYRSYKNFMLCGTFHGRSSWEVKMEEILGRNVVPDVGRLQTSMTECSCSWQILLCCSGPLFGPICAFFNSGPTLCALNLSEPFLPPLLLTNVNESYEKKVLEQDLFIIWIKDRKFTLSKTPSSVLLSSS